MVEAYAAGDGGDGRERGVLCGMRLFPRLKNFSVLVRKIIIS